MSEHKPVAKPEQVKKTNSGTEVKEGSTSSQSNSYGIGPGEMAFASLQSAADTSSRSNGIAQLQTKANQSKGIFQLQAKADARSNRVAEPIQNQGNTTSTTQLKGEMSSSGDHEFEPMENGLGTKTVQLAKAETAAAAPSKLSGTAAVVQLEKDKEASSKGGFIGAAKRFFGFGQPKEKTKKNDVQAAETKDNVGQEAAPKKVEAKAAETTAPPSSGEAEKRELALLQNGIKTIQEEITSFEPRLGEFNSKKLAFNDLEEYADILKKFFNQKGEVDTLLEDLTNEQKKVPPGRKKMFSGDTKIKELLSKDFSKLGTEEYKIIGSIQDIISEVSVSIYWVHTEEFKNKINTYSEQKKQYDEIKFPDSSNGELLEKVKNSKIGFEILLVDLKIIKDKIQGLEEGIGMSLSELDQKKSAFENYPSPRLIDDNTTPNSILLLGVLNADLNRLKEFVIQDYEKWKDEKKDIDALLEKKSAFLSWGLSTEETIRLEKYKKDTEYLNSDEEAQENAALVKQNLHLIKYSKNLGMSTWEDEANEKKVKEKDKIKKSLKSLSKISSDSEELTAKPEIEKNKNGDETTLGAKEIDAAPNLVSKNSIRPEANKKNKTSLFPKTWEEEAKEAKEIMLRNEYERVGYKENKKLTLAKSFIAKTPKILNTLDWDGLKTITEFQELVGKDDNTLKDKVAGQVKNLQADSTQPAGVVKGGLNINKGKKGSEVGESTKTGPVTLAVDSVFEEHGIDIEEVKSVFSDSLVGVLTSIEGILKLKEIFSGEAEVDGRNTAKVAGGIAKLAMAGLKITSTVNDYYATTAVLGTVPFLGVAIETIKFAELYFSNSIAETSERTMEIYTEESQPPNFDNELVFELKEKNVLGSSKVFKHISPMFYKAAKDALNEYSRIDVSLGNNPIATLNKKFNLEKAVGVEDNEKELDLGNYISELETYSLMAKLEEINYTKRIHSRFNLVVEGVKLVGQVMSLIPGGQVAAGALTVAAGSLGVAKSVGVMVNKYNKGDDNGVLGTGKYGEEKHAKYVMHAKKIIEMYSTNAADLIIQQQDVELAKEKDDRIEQNLTVLEKVVYAAGAYPPDVYKSAVGDKKGYKTVGKLVGGMKQR